MLRSYLLAQTYAPAPDFEAYLACLIVDTEAFCRASGVPMATFERLLRQRRTSRKTAERIACGYALAHGQISRANAFRLLFTELPRYVMEIESDGSHHKRH